MIKFFSYFLCGTILLTSLVGKAITILPGDEEENVEKVEVKTGCGYDRPLVVAGMIGNPPFGWVEYDEENSRNPYKSFGLGRDVLDEMSKKLNFSYTSTGFRSFDEAVLALKKGEIDLLLGTYSFAKNLGDGTKILSPGYFQNAFTVYFKAGKEFPVSSLNDLIGKRGIVRREEHLYFLIDLKKPEGVYISQVSGAKKAFEMLLNDEADYLLGSPYSEEAELRRYKVKTKIVSSDTKLGDVSMFFAFSTNSECYRDLKDDFEKILAEDFSIEKTDQMARKIIDDWGERFRDEEGLIKEESEEMMPPIPPTD